MGRFLIAAALGLGLSAGCSYALVAAARPSAGTAEAGEVAALEAKVAQLEQRIAAPELGQQMLELQIRHDRLWWAGKAGNWNLAYYMVSELGEALRGIEETNGEAPELQPQKLSEVMPAMMDPAIRNVQEALAKKDTAAFAQAFDRLSASCNACHATAGVEFLHIQRPKTPLLDNLRYAPAAPR
ncbi:MAG TPA: hypothetical protein VFK29_02975 [Rhodanobacteraceae bacterium]|jgi:hypothetical protein|nr:hypothetical protein [Rhodanobacteraceae bacterium]